MPLDCIMSCLPRYEEEIISSRIFLAFWHRKKVKVAKINFLLKFLILSNFDKSQAAKSNPLGYFENNIFMILSCSN